MFQIRPISMMGVAVAKKKWTLLFLIVTLSFVEAFSQTSVLERKYEISALGFKIGEMTANKSSSPDTTFYKVKSQVSFWFFGKVNVDFSVDSRFSDKKIVWTRSFSNSNKGDYKSEVKWTGNQYKVQASSYKFENTKPILSPVALSSVMLFFHEPKGGEAFLGEAFGLVSKVKKIEENGYEVTINGNTNRYYYQKGVLVRAVMENPIKNYLIKLVE